jgi:hypothetical protein
MSMSFITYNKHINEAFNNPYPLSHDNKGSYGQWSFVTDDDIFYLCTFNFGEEILDDSSKLKYLIITFETESGEMNLTGTGDAFRVLASVIQAARNESKKFKEADYINFAAAGSEPSRQKLYTRFTKILKKMYKFKYTREWNIKADKYYFLSYRDILSDVIKNY